MPTYQLQCSNGHVFDRYLKLANYDDPQTCECGAPAKRQITATMIAPMFEDYQSPIDGKPITSKAKRRDDLARNDCIEYDPEMRKEADQRIKEKETALDRSIDKVVEAEISNMSGSQREALGKELSQGADLSYQRSSGE